MIKDARGTECDDGGEQTGNYENAHSVDPYIYNLARSQTDLCSGGTKPPCSTWKCKGLRLDIDERPSERANGGIEVCRTRPLEIGEKAPHPA